MASEFEEYIKLIGSSVLRQAAQQQQPEPLDHAASQQLQNSRIMLERSSRERLAMVNAARERVARMEATRKKEAADQARIMDVLEENRIMLAERKKFLSIQGYLPEDFGKQWPSLWQQIQRERGEAARQRSRVLNVF